MPGRQYSSKPLGSHAPKRRNNRRKNHRSLDALAIAEKQNPQRIKIQRHRLGESEDAGKKRKRDNEEEGDEFGSAEELSKRRKWNTGESDSSDDGGSDSEGNEWQMGHVNEDDDSELDSDEAMGESDEERFDGFMFRGSSTFPDSGKKSGQGSKKVANGEEVDLWEHDNASEAEGSAQDIEDDFGDEGVDLATALDMNLEAEEEEAREASRSRESKSEEQDEDDYRHAYESTGSDESESAKSELSVSETEDNVEGFSKLRNFVKTMESGNSDSAKPSNRTLSTQEHEKPSDFGLRPTSKLTVEDLMSSVTDPRLRSSLKMMKSAVNAESSNGRDGVPGKLAPPLPKRQQDRIDRSAAYERSKETLGRWIDTVKNNRRAEHISFPLADPDVLSWPGGKRLVPLSMSKPVNDLENTIQTLLQESGMAPAEDKDHEAQIQIIEGLEARKLPIEEVRARQVELRKARDLLFREEIRAKRIKKIKSKAYRRVHRKERDKAAKEERQMLEAAGVDMSEDEHERNDHRRAEERMGGRHRESRWWKAVKNTGRAAWDDGARAGVVDLARRDEELRRRIEGKPVTTEDDGFLEPSSSESDGNESADEEANQSSYIQRKLGDLDVDGTDKAGLHSGLHSMKFMKNAEALRKARNDAQIEDMLRDGGEQTPGQDSPVTGRRKFGQETQETASAPPRQRDELDEYQSSQDEGGAKNDSDKEMNIITEARKTDKSKGISQNNRLLHVSKNQSNGEMASQENPWLVEPRNGLRESRIDSATDMVNNPWLSSSKNKLKESGPNSEVVTADLPTALLKEALKHKSYPEPNVSQDVPGNGGDSPESESDDEQPLGDVVSKRPTISKQDLVRKAFAGDDNLIEEFNREKAEAAEEEGEKVVDNTLPGWGSWTGTGIGRREQKKNQGRFLTKIEGIQQDKRKDAKLEKVIINEKRVKKNAKYLASELPHPFESKQQYERSLRLPVGPEWSTNSTFQDATKPRLLLKQGVIKPIERPTT